MTAQDPVDEFAATTDEPDDDEPQTDERRDAQAESWAERRAYR